MKLIFSASFACLGLVSVSPVMGQAITADWVGPADGAMTSTANWEVGGSPATRTPSLAGDVANIGAGSSVQFPNAHWDSTVNIQSSTINVTGTVSRRANYNVNGVILNWASASAAGSFGLADTTIFNIGAGGLTITNGQSFDWRMRMQVTGAGGVTINSTGGQAITFQQGSYAYQGDTYIQSGRLVVGNSDNLASMTFSFQGNGDSMNKIYGSGTGGTSRLDIRAPLIFDLANFSFSLTTERDWQIIDWSSIANADSGFSVGGSYSIMTDATNWTLVDPLANPFRMDVAGSGRIWTYTDSGGLVWNFNEASGMLSVVPEPSVGAFLLLSGGMLILWRRKK